MHARYFVQKKPPFAAVRLQQLRHEISHLAADFPAAQIQKFIDQTEIWLVYDIYHASQACLNALSQHILTDRVTDRLHTELPENYSGFAVELLPGQFDSRSDAVSQCLGLMVDLSQEPAALQISSGEVYLVHSLSEFDPALIDAIKSAVINSVEAREKSLDMLAPAATQNPDAVPVYDGFNALDDAGLQAFIDHHALAMNLADLQSIQRYFIDEGREPTETEIKVLDTYWSDHCRHTTFFTDITQADFTDKTPSVLKQSWQHYLDLRHELDRQKPASLMDLGTIAARALRHRGLLTDLEDSEEDNACSVVVDVPDTDTQSGAATAESTTPWLLMFKNETHNHPTEIDPFGGAATCIGGAIRDPLSGRAYVYQAMRISGAAYQAEQTQQLAGKLPQTKICRDAAHGYSSYGNQIGLATTLVREIYHPNYVAKRMEVGVVVGGVKQSHVRRESPQTGDVVIMLGGKTGRDGIGGATGSSKAQTQESVSTLSAEVQKGNAVEERKIQRLFRDPAFLRCIKKSNDFGAGGVSVAIGELADSLDVNLDVIPTKYSGLNGTELAIAESQERMAIVIEAKDMDFVLAKAKTENLLACHVATVTDSGYLRLFWRNQSIVNLSRAFLNTNGASRQTTITLASETIDLHSANASEEVTKTQWISALSHVRHANQRALAEHFDASIGSSTVLNPYGGKYQLSPEQVSAQTFLDNRQLTTLASYGFSAELAMQSPYQAGQMAVVESVAKVIAAGANPDQIWLSFQEYFGRLGNDPARWGIPAASLLGALDAQLGLEYAAIGGKDSMSGTFQDIDVPPTLISFAVALAKTKQVMSATLPESSNQLYLLRCPLHDDQQTVDLTRMRSQLDTLASQIKKQRIAAARVVSDSGIAVALTQMAMGNQVGFEIQHEGLDWFAPRYGDILLAGDKALTKAFDASSLLSLGQVNPASSNASINGLTLPLDQLTQANTLGLAALYPEPDYSLPFDKQDDASNGNELDDINKDDFERDVNNGLDDLQFTPLLQSKPKVILPIFPGTNCEYDTQAAFERHGAEVTPLLIRNLDNASLKASAKALTQALASGHILMLSGGFSLADEPDGSAKFIASFLRLPEIGDAVHQLLDRDGLILGICNGFQALIKSGLIPYGEITQRQVSDATLTHNTAGRHVARIANIRVSSTNSPWLAENAIGDQYAVPLSHGEGRVMLSEGLSKQLYANNQVATQYCDNFGKVAESYPTNPNGSIGAIEGLLSPDGKVFGRMAHPERVIASHSGGALFKNIPGIKAHDIFAQGLRYFTGRD